MGIFIVVDHEAVRGCDALATSRSDIGGCCTVANDDSSVDVCGTDSIGLGCYKRCGDGQSECNGGRIERGQSCDIEPIACGRISGGIDAVGVDERASIACCSWRFDLVAHQCDDGHATRESDGDVDA